LLKVLSFVAFGGVTTEPTKYGRIDHCTLDQLVQTKWLEWQEKGCTFSSYPNTVQK
jgi:hypothetical protein